jgi:hypothetical protein
MLRVQRSESCLAGPSSNTHTRRSAGSDICLDISRTNFSSCAVVTVSINGSFSAAQAERVRVHPQFNKGRFLDGNEQDVRLFPDKPLSLKRQVLLFW